MSSPELASLTLGFIGYGNMGRALAGGVARNPELCAAFPLKVYEQYEPSAQAARDEGIDVLESAAALADASDIILLAVKPDQMGAVLDEIAPKLHGGKLLLSIAAGITLDKIRWRIKGICPAARVMPNTLALVGQGIFGLCFDSAVTDNLKDAVRSLFSGLGDLFELPEAKFNAFTALSGSGPAYVFHFMESLAEAGVSVGLDRQSSRKIALGLVRGAAAMVEQTGEHTAVLREQVSSPAGTTIAAINHFDRQGVRGHVIDAVHAALARGKAMESES